GNDPRRMVRLLYVPHRKPGVRHGVDSRPVAARVFARAVCQTRSVHMTLELRDVTKKIRIGAVRAVYEDLNLRIEEGANVALLGPAEAGLEGLVKLICGADAPDAGRVIRGHSISWPLPSTVFMHQHVTLAGNARFLARLYEVDPREYIDRLAGNGLDKYMDVL